MILRILAALLLFAALANAQISGAGNLGCSGQVTSYTAVTTSTATGVFATVATGTPAPFFWIQLNQTSTITGGAVTFQVTYDGTNWVSLPVGQLFTSAFAPIANPYSFVSSTNQSFIVMMNGASGLRLNLTAALTGSGPPTVTAFSGAVCGMIGPLGVYNSSLPTMSNGGTGLLQFDVGGQLRVIGTPSNSSTSALSTFRSAALTSTTTVKSGSPGNLYAWYIYNPNSSVCSLDLFNTTSPTLGTTTPIVSLAIPATSGANIPPGVVALSSFSTAISAAAVTAAGGGTTCGTGMVVNLWYQ